MSGITEHQLWTRFQRVIQSSDDAPALILKGQLLVEEVLDTYLTHIFQDTLCYQQARLTFNQKYSLARAHVDFDSWYDDCNEDCQLVKLTFDYVGSLNKLRNRLAHNAEYTELERDLRRDLELPDTATSGEVVQEIRGHIFYLYYYLEGFVSETAAKYNHPTPLLKLRQKKSQRHDSKKKGI